MAEYNTNDLTIDATQPMDSEDADKIGEALRETRRVLKTLLSAIMEESGALKPDIINGAQLKNEIVGKNNLTDDIGGNGITRNATTKELDLNFDSDYFSINTAGELTFKTGINLNNFVSGLSSNNINDLRYQKLTHDDSTAGKFLISQGGGNFSLLPITGALDVDANGNTNLTLATAQARLAETKGATVHAGSSGTNWVQRPITVEQSDSSGKVTLSGGNFILSQGSYLVLVRAPGYACDGFMARLRNTTDSVVVANGSSAYSPVGGAQSFSEIYAAVDIPSGENKTFTIESICETARVDDGLGRSANVGEENVYTQVQIFLMQQI